MTISLKAQEIKGFNWAIRIKDWLTHLDTRLYFIFIFIYHLLVIFQGLDFNDEGFHLAFYQQIFSDPQSVQYAFWGWLTGLLGGLFLKLFPFLGMLGIRMLGAFISTCTIILAYNLLKEYLGKAYLLVALLLLSFYINEDAKNLYYNNFSAFLYMVAATYLFHGLRKNKNLLITIGGFFVGLNIFSRIPNVLGISMVVAISYYGYLQKTSWRKIMISLPAFFGGVALACIFVLITMVAFHQLKYFTGSIRMIFSPSRGAKDDGLNGAYGFSRLLTSNIIDYARSLRFVLIIGAVGFIIGYINYLGNQARRSVRVSIQFLNYALLLLGLTLVFNGWFTSFRLMEFFVGMSLLSAPVLFHKKAAPEYKLLAMLGLLITLIHPFGSSEGISTVVVYSMWLSFPIALNYLSGFSSISLGLSIQTNAGNSHIKTILARHKIHDFKVSVIFIIALASLYNVIRFPYLCDKHSRWDMRYSVDNQFMHGVYTSKERVRDLNELLAASAKFVKPNDTVLAYDCMPMYHFMTQTRSYVRNPCIWFYTTDMFREELDLAQSSNRHLPVIVRQLIKTTGEGSAWPDIKPQADYLQLPRNQGKNNILNEFIKKNGYIEAWNNGDFAILVPSK